MSTAALHSKAIIAPDFIALGMARPAESKLRPSDS
jgi:hypothetical protein